MTEEKYTINKVLVCEDNADVRLMLVFMLEYRLGVNVTSCFNGLEAMELLKKEKFDLVVSDFEMETENGSGKDLFAYMLLNGISCPFIMLSSYFKNDFNEFLNHSNFRFVSKLQFEDLFVEISGLKRA